MINRTTNSKIIHKTTRLKTIKTIRSQFKLYKARKNKISSVKICCKIEIRILSQKNNLQQTELYYNQINFQIMNKN